MVYTMIHEIVVVAVCMVIMKKFQKTSDDSSKRNSFDYTEVISEINSNIVNELMNSQ